MKAPQEFAAGVFLLVIAAIGFFGAGKLSFGRLAAIGPGFMPQSVIVMLAALGLLLVAMSFTSNGAPLSRWTIRAPVFVFGAALLFGWTIRPLGLIIAGPLAVIFASFADRETKWLEVIVFAAVMTAFCIGLFSFLLRLPIPIMPSGLPFPFDAILK